MRVIPVLFVAMAFASQPVFAQEPDGATQNADHYLMEQGTTAPTPTAVAPDAPKAPEVAPAPKDSPEMIAKKADLAREMHQIRPTRVQVDAAVEQAAKGMPDEQRRAFISAMKTVLNYNAIEKISIDAMVETFTLSELQAMVNYHKMPEAKSISEKMPNWAMKVQPEVVRMLDAAIMRVKTGDEGATAPAPKP
jgi:hypothetical protein